ncbi:uncharacterized protein BX663DRAFT_554531 [Cokeromyces recurvatus]|uniref:uncharacterized protein n=1 Tax=Cokeromyces recurvatus TaxID=90255 RepID=UPI00221F6261|nr:uncharacterized protein BX663DRAFT_554531 [Cokeromyces recurvatus]KAI7899819.1 hypothetical protein BX663DRAFT_554531 [Cokeromyces recurvatus]
MSRILKQSSAMVPTTKHHNSSKQDESNQIGQRVTIPSLNNMTGVLKYVGETDFRPGLWAGIELDKKGEGKNDGSVQGKQYFTCSPNSGIFISFNKIIIQPPLSISTEKPLSSTRRSNLPITRHRTSYRNLNSLSSSSSSSSSSTTTIPNTRKSKIVAPRATVIPKLPSTIKLSSSPATPTNLSHSIIKKSTITPNSKRSTPISPSSTPPPQSTQRIMTPIQRRTVTPITQTTKTPKTPTTPTTPMAQPTKTPTPPPPPSQSPPPPPSSSLSSPPLPLPPPVVPTIFHQEHIETTHQLYDMLEKTQHERDKLLKEMENKETAWERLVSSKESLTLQVQDSELQRQRLTKEVERMQQVIQKLEQSIADRDASIAKNQRDEVQQNQDQRRIERLEQLVKDLQSQIQIQKEEQDELNRVHAGTLDQVRREAAASEANTASLEKECEELKRAGLEAIHAYELQVIKLKEMHCTELEQRDQLIKQLEYTIADLKHKQSTLFDDDEQDIDCQLSEMHFNQTTEQQQQQQQSQHENQRHRLEEQLELATTELEHERQTIQMMAREIEQLKLDLRQAQQQTLSMEQKFEAIQNDFDKEMNDKKRLIEEADNAFEAQAKAEDEHYQMKLSKMALEKEHNELLESHKQLERDYNSLLDEMLMLEKQDLKEINPNDKRRDISNDPIMLQQKMKELEEEIKSYQQTIFTDKKEIKQLTKDLNELESLIESRVFSEAELEEKLEDEKRKVKALEKELNILQNRMSHGSQKGLLISPTTTTTTTSSSPIPSPQFNNKKYGEKEEEEEGGGGGEMSSAYCELCEEYGHDILQCKVDFSVIAGTEKKKEKNLFCDNCESYGNHTTENCPNQDETF